MEQSLTLHDLHAQLIEAAQRVRDFPGNTGYRNERDTLIRTALAGGMRPGLIAQDTGLHRNRLYQIRDGV